MLIDSHAHLSMPQFDKGRREVVGGTSEAGVLFIFTVETNATSGRQAVTIGCRGLATYAVGGAPPENPKNTDGETHRQILEIAQDPQVRGR